MGKTIKKNQTRRTVRGVLGSRYIVKGKTYGIENATASGIAAQMLEDGYRNGASVRWNGSEYRLSVDHYGDASLARVLTV